MSECSFLNLLKNVLELVLNGKRIKILSFSKIKRISESFSVFLWFKPKIKLFSEKDKICCIFVFCIRYILGD